MTSRQHIVELGYTWLGTRWRHQAMRKGVGTDCIGFIAGVGMEAGVLGPDASVGLRKAEYRSYGRDPDPKLLLEACDYYADRIKIGDAGLGDVLVFRVINGVYPQHFGLVTKVDEDGKPKYVIHASNVGKRCVVENRIDDAWRSRIMVAYKFRGL